MRKIKLYIATSIDGKIAKPNGDIGWLEKWNSPDEDYGYKTFLNSVDTTLMGNKTYIQVLGFEGDFPYEGKTNYVFTRNQQLKEDENVKYISKDHITFIKDLKKSPGRDIWLIGGGETNSALLVNWLIDDMIIFIIPVILGDGIPLFGSGIFKSQLKLIKTKTYDNGVIELNYKNNNAL